MTRAARSTKRYRWFIPVLGTAWGTLIVAVIAGQLNDHVYGDDRLIYPFSAVSAITFTILGGLIVPRRPLNPVGWIFVVIGISSSIAVLGATYAGYRPMGWVTYWMPTVAYGLLPLVLMLFPTGRLPSRAWRPAAFIATAGLALGPVCLALVSWMVPRLVHELDVPLSGAAHVIKLVGKAGLLISLASIVPAIVSLLVRWRSASGDMRQQLKWLAVGSVVLPFGFILEIVSHLPWVEVLAATTVPVAATVAILNYRLYDIDLFLNRSMVYATLTILVAAVYSALVDLINRVFADAEWGPWVTTAVIAAAIYPLQQQVQWRVNRLLYGKSDDAYTVISDLGRQLDQAVDVDTTTMLATAVQTISEALRLPYVAVDLRIRDGVQRVASYGRRVTEPLQFPMIYKWQILGVLLVTQRSPSQPLKDKERNLLHDLAHRIALALHERATISLGSGDDRAVDPNLL